MIDSDIYIYAIAALLPLTACIVLFQVNPYHALVVRGVLGAVSAMIYAVLGAADVALTEALVGTLLGVTLYAIAVRSSLVMRLGVLKEELEEINQTILKEGQAQNLFGQLMTDIRKVFSKYYMRIELNTYQNLEELNRALENQEIHTTCIKQVYREGDEIKPYQTTTRVKRLYNIMKDELSSSATMLTYSSETNLEEKHP